VTAKPGNGGPPGTKSCDVIVPDEYPDIQAAVDAASPGATVCVKDGTYAEQVVINKDLTLKSAGGATPTIVPGSSPDSFTIAESGPTWEPMVFAYGGTETGGAVVSVADEEILDAKAALARTAGFCAEVASATTLAGVRRLSDSGELEADDSVVAVLTGTGFRELDAAGPDPETVSLADWRRAATRPAVLWVGALNVVFAVAYAQMGSTVPVFASETLGVGSERVECIRIEGSTEWWLQFVRLHVPCGGDSVDHGRTQPLGV